MSARLAYAAFVVSSPGLVASVGCGRSSSSSSPADAAAIDEDAGQCPATVALTIGAACGADGLECAPAYPCGLVPVPLECTCDQGVFACTDVTGRAIGAGDTPACPPPPDAGCPADEDSASLAPCGEVGLLCAYPSACGLGVDSCECTQAVVLEAGVAGLLFACSPAICEASEAGIVGADVGSEAAPGPDGTTPGDSGPGQDATLDAASWPDADASPDGSAPAPAIASDSGAEAQGGPGD